MLNGDILYLIDLRLRFKFTFRKVESGLRINYLVQLILSLNQYFVPPFGTLIGFLLV